MTSHSRFYVLKSAHPAPPSPPLVPPAQPRRLLGLPRPPGRTASSLLSVYGSPPPPLVSAGCTHPFSSQRRAATPLPRAARLRRHNQGILLPLPSISPGWPAFSHGCPPAPSLSSGCLHSFPSLDQPSSPFSAPPARAAAPQEGLRLPQRPPSPGQCRPASRDCRCYSLPQDSPSAMVQHNPGYCAFCP